MSPGLRHYFFPAALSLVIATAAFADDRTELNAMLNAFLAGVDRPEIHDAFWADDLVYTSSAGSRTSKADIMAGFDGSEAESGSAPVYSAEDVQINVYGDAAIVAFQLVAVNPDAPTQRYLNTGTFLKRDGRWQVVAWQATQIPGQ